MKKQVVVKSNIRIVIDELPSGMLPVYDPIQRDTSLPVYRNVNSNSVLVTNPDEVGEERHDTCRGKNFAVRLYPITPEFCRSMAKTIEVGQEEGMSLGVLVVNKEKSTVGFFVR